MLEIKHKEAIRWRTWTYKDKYVVDSISQISSLKQEADFVVEVGENNKESCMDDVTALTNILPTVRPS